MEISGNRRREKPSRSEAVRRTETTRRQGETTSTRPEGPTRSTRPERESGPIRRETGVVSTRRELGTSPTRRDTGTSPTRREMERETAEAPRLASRFSDEMEASTPRGAASEAAAVEEREEGGGSFFDRLRGRVEEVRDNAARREEEELREAAEVYQEWSQDPEGLSADLQGADLTELSNSERLALVQLSQEDEGVGRATQDALRDTFENIESFGDIPTDRGFQALLANGRSEELDERLSGLLSEELNSSLSDRLENASGDEETDQALDRYISDIEGIAESRPGLAHLLESQAISVLEGAAEEVDEARRADDNWLQRANHSVTGFVRGATGFVGDRLRDVGNIAGTVLDSTLDIAGDLQEFAINTAGNVGGFVADSVGAEGVGDNIRSGAQRAGDLVDSAYDFVGEQSGNFTRGFAEGAAGAAEGIGQVLTDPVGTVQAVGALIENPGLVVDSFRAIADEHGVAGAAGAVAFEVLTAAVTGGGGTAARISGAAGRAANLLDNAGSVARVAGLADNAGSVARIATNTGGRLADLGAGGFRAVARTADTVGDLTRPIRNGARQATDALVSPLRAGGRAVADSALGQGVRNGAGRLGHAALDLVPDGIRQPISRLRRGTRDLFTGDDSADFARRSREIQGQNPHLAKNAADARTRLADLSTEFDKLGKSLQGDALADARRAALAPLLDADGDLARYARGFDEVAVGHPPGGVGDIVAHGRVDVLRHLRENLDTIDPNAARRVVRGLLADGDLAGPAYLTRLGPNDRIFRAFDAADTADGGYLSRAADARLDPVGQRRASALLEKNNAKAGVVATVGEESLALVTRVADQTTNLPKFGPHATGGGWQLQLFNDGSLRSRLAQVGGNGPLNGALPSGVDWLAPGTPNLAYDLAAALRSRALRLGELGLGAGQGAATFGPVLATQLGPIGQILENEIGGGEWVLEEVREQGA